MATVTTKAERKAAYQKRKRREAKRRRDREANLAASLASCGWSVVCHAFPLGESKGTNHCIKAMKDNNIDVVAHYSE
jgi:hypothetical protein